MFPGTIPACHRRGGGPGFGGEVYSTSLGAGDAFMAGLLPRLAAASWERSATGPTPARAIAVSRLLCSPEYATSGPSSAPSLHPGAVTPRLREDAALNPDHRTTTRAKQWPGVDGACHRSSQATARPMRRNRHRAHRLPRLKELAIDAAARAAAGREGFRGSLRRHIGRSALFRASEQRSCGLPARSKNPARCRYASNMVTTGKPAADRVADRSRRHAHCAITPTIPRRYEANRMQGSCSSSRQP